jgi:hypothetical protein
MSIRKMEPNVRIMAENDCVLFGEEMVLEQVQFSTIIVLFTELVCIKISWYTEVRVPSP